MNTQSMLLKCTPYILQAHRALDTFSPLEHDSLDAVDELVPEKNNNIEELKHSQSSSCLKKYYPLHY